MDRLTLIALLTLGFILIGSAIRFRDTRLARWFAATGIVVGVVTLLLRLVLGG